MANREIKARKETSTQNYAVQKAKINAQYVI
jgi:hypothetical protein